MPDAQTAILNRLLMFDARGRQRFDPDECLYCGAAMALVERPDHFVRTNPAHCDECFRYAEAQLGKAAPALCPTCRIRRDSLLQKLAPYVADAIGSGTADPAPRDDEREDWFS